MKPLFFVLLISLVLCSFLGFTLIGQGKKLEQLQRENDHFQKKIAFLEKANLELTQQRDAAMVLMNKLTKSLGELNEKVNAMPEMKEAMKNSPFPPLPPLQETDK